MALPCRWYDGGMKVKTSVTLSRELLDELDGRVGQGSRSSFIEDALKRRLREVRRAEREAHAAALYASLAPAQVENSDVAQFGVDPLLLGDDVELTDEVLDRIAHEDARRASR